MIMAKGNAKHYEPGTIFEKEYKGKHIKVKVLKDGTFSYDGKAYPSLTATVKKITGGKTTPATVFFGIAPTPRQKKTKPENNISIPDPTNAVIGNDTLDTYIRMMVREEIRNFFRG